MNKFFEDYCSEMTIHVLRYVTRHERPLLERIFWGLLCLLASALLVCQVVSDWNTVTSGPVQVVVTSPRFALTKIDFPAVTVCPVNKIRRSKLEKITLRNLRKIDAATSERYKRTIVALSLISFPTFDHPLDYLLFTNTTPYPIDNKIIPQLMHEVTPTIDEMIARCFWRGNRYNCSDLFRIQRTEQGFCFSFNSKTAERRHNTSFMNPPYLEPDGSLSPLRSNSAGKITGLELFFMQPHDEYITEGITNVGTATGYLFMIHNPLQYPGVLHNFLVTESSKKIARFQVSVAATFEDPSLKRLDDNARGCRLESSKAFLRANESQSNCYQLCRFAWIQKLCGCVPYYYFLPDGKTVFCGIQHLECLAKHKAFLQAEKIAKVYSEQDTVPGMECSCHPTCSYVAYTTEFYFNWRETDIHDYEYYAYVDVFYKKNWAIGYSRQAKYSIKDFLVGIGGVGGLYLGGSLISCVEIIYILINFIRFLLPCKQRRYFEIMKKKPSVVVPFVN